MEGFIFSLLATSFALYIGLRFRHREARRKDLRYGMRQRLVGQECGEVDGVALGIEYDFGEPEDLEDPQYIDRYLVFAYTVEVDGQAREFQGRHYTPDSLVAEPSFAMAIGRPVRVRYLPSRVPLPAVASAATSRRECHLHRLGAPRH